MQQGPWFPKHLVPSGCPRNGDGASPSLLLALLLLAGLFHKKKQRRGAWVARSVERRTSAQVMIPPFPGLSPESGSMLTAQSLAGACFRFYVSFSLCPSPAHTVSLSKIIKKH